VEGAGDPFTGTFSCTCHPEQLGAGEIEVPGGTVRAAESAHDAAEVIRLSVDRVTFHK